MRAKGVLIMNNKKAQSLIGYLIILAAVVGGLIIASNSVKSAVESRLGSAISEIGGIVTK